MKKAIFIILMLLLAVVLFNRPGESIPAVSEKRIPEDRLYDAVGYEAVEVRVMTYNIHRGVGRSGRLDLDDIAEAIIGSGADIIAVQEVERFSFRTGFEDQIDYLADKLSMKHVFGKSINILNGQYGNGLLSVYPIKEYEVIPLYSEGEQRTLLRAILDVKGKTLTIYNTHLGLNEAERSKQLEELMEHAAKEENLIITGDFNTKADKLGAVTALLKDSGAGGIGENRVTFVADGLSERIDYIFASENIDIIGYEVLDTEASDHYPVISTLSINN